MSLVLSKKKLIKLLKRDSTFINQITTKSNNDVVFNKFGILDNKVTLRIDIEVNEDDK